MGTEDWVLKGTKLITNTKKQREIQTDLGDIYISFWNNSDDWFIKSAEEMGINHESIMGGMKFD